MLSCASRLLAREGADAVTFSRVSQESRVARSTLYRHWRSRDELLCAASIPGFSLEAPDGQDGGPAGGTPVESVLARYLTQIGDGLAMPEAITAFAHAMEAASSSPTVERNFRLVADAFQRVLAERVGPLDSWDHARIVGPVFFRALVMREPTDAATIEKWVGDLMRLSVQVPATGPLRGPSASSDPESGFRSGEQSQQ